MAFCQYAYRGKLINFQKLSRELAKAGIEVSPSYLSYIFSGKRAIPWDVAKALSNHFKVSLDEIAKLLEESEKVYKIWKETPNW